MPQGPESKSAVASREDAAAQVKPLKATLNLPQMKPITVRAVVSWIDEGPESQIGIRYEPDDERRREIKKWVEDYLEIA